MQALTTYVSDEDDAYDNTYATFRFVMTKTDFIARMRSTRSRRRAWSSPRVRTTRTCGKNSGDGRSLSLATWRSSGRPLLISALPGNFDEKV